MSDSSGKLEMKTDEAIEVLLEHAAPRQAPPRDDEDAIRDAVHAEWRIVTRRHQTRRRMTHFAIAATVLLAIAVSFNSLRFSDVEAIQVATISKSHGSIYLLGEQSVLHEMTDLAVISAGQVIDTGDGAGIGLEWGNGGSLRVDQNTRIEFTSAEAVYLHYGQIYFDSQSAPLASSITGGSDNIVAAITGSGLEIKTDHGSVKHLGTQYMTYVDTRVLSVSVREGQVTVDGSYVNQKVAHEGEQLTISGGAPPLVVDIKGYGETWDWIETTAPAVQLDGKPIDEFLRWVSRETGLELQYEGGAAEIAMTENVVGEVNATPREELRLRMFTANFDYHIDGGTITVSAIDSGSRQ